MNDLTVSDPCIVFALAREASAFLREFRPQQHFLAAPCRARFCGPEWLTVLVVETGIGPEGTRRALDWLSGPPLLENVAYRPKLVLSAGFAGALQESFRVGDVILATDVVNREGRRWAATWPTMLPAGEWRPPLHRGRVVTADRLVAEPADKEQLGRTHEAVAVDMESAVIAAACHDRGVPFGCVRVISDDLRTRLSPALVKLLSGGRISPVRVAAALAGSPRLIGEFWRLARDTRQAAAQLGLALGELLTLTLPWAAPGVD